MSGLETRIARLKATGRRALAAPVVADRSAWNWYAESCPCGLPPGDCRAHPRARMTQRRPRATGGSGLTSPDVGPARRGPGPAGSSAASTPAS